MQGTSSAAQHILSHYTLIPCTAYLLVPRPCIHGWVCVASGTNRLAFLIDWSNGGVPVCVLVLIVWILT